MKPAQKNQKSTLRFEAVKIDPLFEVLDAIAFIDGPTTKDIAQYADIDGRTAGKILKNARLIGLVQSPDDNVYVLAQPYPYKGTREEKQRVVREALLRLQLIRNIRQFMALGNDLHDAMRKAATVVGEKNYDKAAIAPLVTWANSVAQVLDLGVRVETLVNEAVATKEARHAEHEHERVAFISHSTKDKPFVRKLAADLVANGVKVWLDEQRILVGDSIPEKIAQGLAESDFFLIVVSKNSSSSEWVKKELNNALVHEIERRKVTVMPIKTDDAEIPASIKDKLYADFTGSYDEGFNKLLDSINAREVVTDGRPS
ncbi:MAG: toll/interleukin-1 receptor domain-containing protein [Terriglobia bacterium]